MALGQHSVTETYYDILCVKENASYEEIRASYRSSVLNYHPDKLQTTSERGCADHSMANKFLMIQKAWEVLGDAKSRRLYDTELLVSRQDTGTAEDVGLEDMMVEDAGDVLQLSYQCRCGDYLCVDSQELEEMGCPISRDGSVMTVRTLDNLPASIVLPCGSCSLRIRLLIEPDAIVSIG
ncbi:hypothetical protein BT93_F0587 [Corymbia citriodora subsp. variegata]|nr:hypothetical protein BT93_F0587 [Corymbia citriodora subsp. variegata]